MAAADREGHDRHDDGDPAGDTVLVSASRGPGGEEGAVYRRPVGSDGPFERCHEGLPEWFPGNVDTFCLAGGADVAVIGTADGRVFTSQYEGITWDEAVAGLPRVRGIALVG